MKNKTIIVICLSSCLALAACRDTSDEMAGNMSVNPEQMIHIGGISADGLTATASMTRADSTPVDEEDVRRTDAENISWLVDPLKSGLDITYGKEGNPRTNERVAILKLLTVDNGGIKYSVDGDDKYAEYSFLYRHDTNGKPTDEPAIWYDNGAHFFEGLYVPDEIKYTGSDASDVYNATSGKAKSLTTDQHNDASTGTTLGNYTLLSRYLAMPSGFTLNATVARVKLPFRHRLARVLAYILIDPEMGSDVTIDGDVTLSGDVNLILCDGKTLTVNGSIMTEFDGSYTPVNSLAAYAQSGGTGALNITPSADAPGIYAKNLDIHGGVITATVYGNEAGLESSNEMNIYAGTINTAGGNGFMKYGPNVLSIYNADITAVGITNGIQATTGIMMYSGLVMATGGNAASGSNSNGNPAISTAALTVNGGTLFAKGGAADGSGSNGTGINNTATITLGTGITFYQGTTIPGMAAVYTTPVTCSQQFVRIE